MEGIILGLLIGLTTSVIAILASRRKTKAETTDILTQAAERVTTMLTDQLNAASREVAALHEQLQISTSMVSALKVDVERLTGQVRRLRQVIVALGGDPDSFDHHDPSHG